MFFLWPTKVCIDQICWLFFFLTARLSKNSPPPHLAKIFDIENDPSPYKKNDIMAGKIFKKFNLLGGLQSMFLKCIYKTRTQVSGIFKGHFEIIIGCLALIGGHFVTDREIWPFSHHMEKENFCSSDLYEISHTYHQLKSTTTSKVLLTFDLGNRLAYWIFLLQ